MILVITEKPSMSKKIGAALGLAFAGGRYEGVYDGKDIVMMNLRGHILTLKNPDEIAPEITWDTLDLFKDFPRRFELKIAPAMKSDRKGGTPADMYARIEAQLKRSDLEEVWLATDADDEGELLGWEVLEYANHQGPVKRIWISRGEDKKALNEAFENRFDASKTRCIAHAAEAKRRADWMYMYLVRTCTYLARRQAFGPNLGTGKGAEAVFSVGRVQTPALSMIVTRDKEIENFVKKNHFLISGAFEKQGQSLRAKMLVEYTPEVRNMSLPGIEWEPQGRPEDNKPDRPLFVDKGLVESFRDNLKQHADQAVVAEYTEGRRQKQPPKPYSLTDAQKDIGKKLKLSGSKVQLIVSDLYEQGYTSYPRTPNAELPMSMYTQDEIVGMCDAVRGIPDFQEVADRIKKIHVEKNDTYEAFVPKCFVNKEMGHTGLVPTHSKMTAGRLADLRPQKKDDKGKTATPEQMAGVYKMIVARFLAAMLPPAELATQKGKIVVPVEDLLKNPKSTFSIKGERIVDKGFLNYFGDEGQATTFPPLSEGERIRLSSVDLKPETTRPPHRYDTATLPKEMENVAKLVSDPKYKRILEKSEGIGTPATREAIIKVLINRGYVEVKKEEFYSTQKGRDVINALPNSFVSPETTAIWEGFLAQIKEADEETALAKQAEFVTRQGDRINKLIYQFIDHYGPKMKELVVTASKTSANMMKLLQAIEKASGKKAPPNAKNDSNVANKFIKENYSYIEELKKAPPSEAQINLAKKLSDQLKIEIPEDVLTNKIACAKFIDKNIASTPPSEAQIKFAKKLASEMEDAKKPSEEIYKSSKLCREFIDKALGNDKKSGSKNRKPATRSRKTS